MFALAKSRGEPLKQSLGQPLLSRWIQSAQSLAPATTQKRRPQNDWLLYQLFVSFTVSALYVSVPALIKVRTDRSNLA
jgi:hypothetical protein